MQVVSNDKRVKEITEGCITSPKGFMAAGIQAGIKKDKRDLGVIVSEVPATCAAVYTTNTFQAAPITVTKDSIASQGQLQAVLVNSGCANACTGEKGLQDAFESRRLLASKLSIEEHLIAVASTGVIGQLLPMDKIEKGIGQLEPNASLENAVDFQHAILTTDLTTKTCTYSAEIDGKIVTMSGAAKGSGMIHPNMATMLGFITTDANIAQTDLQALLGEVTDSSFNQITVDGDTSTNDTVIVMANGLAKNNPLTKNHQDWPLFVEMLAKTSESLAKMIARDGEGATKLIEVEVLGAKSREDAQKIAKQIVGSSLVKSAVFGADANWGRIISAIGQTDADVNPHTVDISIGSIDMLKNSEPLTFSEEEALAYLKEEEVITIKVNLHCGDESGKAWGCDLTYDYVKINASYRS